PTGAVAAATGGTLQAGTYLIAYTYTGTTGETLVSPTASVTTTGTTGSITGATGAALVAPNTGTNWYISTLGGAAATLRLVGAGTGAAAPTITAVPAATAASPPTATGGVTTVTITGKSLPMYRLVGARNFGNTSQRAEIDTTASGDTDMTGAPGRAKRAGAFTFLIGDTIVNQAGRTITMKNMLEASAKAGLEVVLVAQNDTRNALLPRDAQFAFIGNTDMQRNLGAVIDMPITWYQAACSDATSYEFLDYVA
ncbi:MAG: hypothetical protein LC793_16390, partial [Thermomicrobia bacterium]|nr:hypothetical protein [Thermomicrobia bacterium]